MTQVPSEAAKRKACELIEATVATTHKWHDPAARAFALHLDEVDRVAKALCVYVTKTGTNDFDGYKAARAAAISLMLPNEPDALEEICLAMFPGEITGEVAAKRLRAELDKRGLTLTAKEG